VNTPAVAPRAAYLLTAAMADNTQQAGAIQVALTMLGDKLGAETEMDWDGTARVVCSEALIATQKLIRPAAGEIQAYVRLGLTPVMIAARCWQSADEPQSSPHS
jgi:hypothetical protein